MGSRNWYGFGVSAALALAGCGGAAGSHVAPFQTLGTGNTGSVAARAVGFATAKAGLSAAESAARGWDGGAKLARLEGSSIEAGYMAGDWSYTFYAAGKKEEALVVVWDGSRTRSHKVAKAANALPIFSAFNVDSNQAVGIAGKNGLASNKVYDLSLDEANAQRRLQWSLHAPEGEFVIDGTTGKLLKAPGN
ncbi:MAG: hypothetical protein FJZ00_02285 [Candidatus Sericytochromatia bacterium]|uniref:Lipoprotein n=1 Tax=Candidatus Tanganyikabacteria bacterium TaxID=2961651 RepID=A0A937X0Y5_9BACT|nr:hypothetical protein [Candidatus Tanganyikabacteria bacterium]